MQSQSSTSIIKQNESLFIIHEKLVLDVDISEKIIAGFADLFVGLRDGCTVPASIRFNARQFHVSHVTVNGEDADFTHEPEADDPLPFLPSSNQHEGASPQGDVSGHRDLASLCAHHKSVARASTEKGELEVWIPQQVAETVAEQARSQMTSDERSPQQATEDPNVSASLVVRVYYELVHPCGGAHFVCADPINPDTPSYVHTHNQSGCASQWLPCLEGSLSTFEFVVTTAADMVVVASGQLLSQQLEAVETQEGELVEKKISVLSTGGRRVLPQSVSLAVGPFHVLPDPAAPSWLTHFCMPGKEREAKLSHTTEFTRKAIQFYEEYLGVKYTADVQPAYQQLFIDNTWTAACSSAGSATLSEHLLHDSTDIEQTVETRTRLAQCIAQQFFGHLVYQESWSDSWLIVGLSGYLARLFARSFFGTNEFKYRVYKDMADVCAMDAACSQPLHCDTWAHPSELFTRLMHRKAPLVIHMLEKKLGKASFQKLLSRLVADALGKQDPSATSSSPQEGVAGNQPGDQSAQLAMDVEATTTSPKTPAPPQQTPSEPSRVGKRTVRTAELMDMVKRMFGLDLADFAREWIYSPGCLTIECGFKYDPKRNVIEFAVKQDLSGGRRKYTGGLTVRVHETDATYDHTLYVDDENNYFEFPCNSRPKRPKKKGPDGPPQGPSGPNSASAAEIESSRLEVPILWIRVDPELHCLRKVTFRQPETMWFNQLEKDRDVIAQCEAVRALGSSFHQSTRALSVMVDKCLNDHDMYYGARIEAVFSIARYKEPSVAFGSLVRHFRQRYCGPPDGSMVRPNNFTDLASYYVKKALVLAMATVPHEASLGGAGGAPPLTPVGFVMDLLRNNDNTGNEFSDHGYVAALVDALGYMATKDTAEAAVGCIQHALACEARSLSFHGTIAQSCFFALTNMHSAGLASTDPQLYWAFLEPVHHHEVRKAALWCLLRTAAIMCAAYHQQKISTPPTTTPAKATHQDDSEMQDPLVSTVLALLDVLRTERSSKFRSCILQALMALPVSCDAVTSANFAKFKIIRSAVRHNAHIQKHLSIFLPDASDTLAKVISRTAAVQPNSAALRVLAKIREGAEYRKAGKAIADSLWEFLCTQTSHDSRLRRDTIIVYNTLFGPATPACVRPLNAPQGRGKRGARRAVDAEAAPPPKQQRVTSPPPQQQQQPAEVAPSSPNIVKRAMREEAVWTPAPIAVTSPKSDVKMSPRSSPRGSPRLSPGLLPSAAPAVHLGSANVRSPPRSPLPAQGVHSPQLPQTDSFSIGSPALPPVAPMSPPPPPLPSAAVRTSPRRESTAAPVQPPPFSLVKEERRPVSPIAASSPLLPATPVSVKAEEPYPRAPPSPALSVSSVASRTSVISRTSAVSRASVTGSPGHAARVKLRMSNVPGTSPTRPTPFVGTPSSTGPHAVVRKRPESMGMAPGRPVGAPPPKGVPPSIRPPGVAGSTTSPSPAPSPATARPSLGGTGGRPSLGAATLMAKRELSPGRTAATPVHSRPQAPSGTSFTLGGGTPTTTGAPSRPPPAAVPPAPRPLIQVGPNAGKPMPEPFRLPPRRRQAARLFAIQLANRGVLYVHLTEGTRTGDTLWPSLPLSSGTGTRSSPNSVWFDVGLPLEAIPPEPTTLGQTAAHRRDVIQFGEVAYWVCSIPSVVLTFEKADKSHKAIKLAEPCNIFGRVLNLDFYKGFKQQPIPAMTTASVTRLRRVVLCIELDENMIRVMPRTQPLTPILDPLGQKSAVLEIDVDMYESSTSDYIMQHLPVKSLIQVFGEMMYFPCVPDTVGPLGAYINNHVTLSKPPPEPVNNRDCLLVGEVAFWAEGNAILVGTGQTPIAMNSTAKRMTDRPLFESPAEAASGGSGGAAPKPSGGAAAASAQEATKIALLSKCNVFGRIVSHPSMFKYSSLCLHREVLHERTAQGLSSSDAIPLRSRFMRLQRRTVKFSFENVRVEGQEEKISFEILAFVKDTVTGDLIYDALPLATQPVKTYGEEVYFPAQTLSAGSPTQPAPPTPALIEAPLEIQHSRQLMNDTDIAYWREGHSIVIGYGRTPSFNPSYHREGQIVLAGNCNVWAESLERLPNTFSGCVFGPEARVTVSKYFFSSQL